MKPKKEKNTNCFFFPKDNDKEHYGLFSVLSLKKNHHIFKKIFANFPKRV